nr:hypothetical protein [Tanacetum cinerariifolium]
MLTIMMMSAAVAYGHGGDGGGDDPSHPLHVQLALVAEVWEAEKPPGEAEEAAWMEELRGCVKPLEKSRLRQPWKDMARKRSRLNRGIKGRCF